MHLCENIVIIKVYFLRLCDLFEQGEEVIFDLISIIKLADIFIVVQHRYMDD